MNTKERIIKEAMKLFSIRGYDAVSIRTIACHVGIGNSALYKHFSSKQAIFDAIVETCKHHFTEQCTYVLCDLTADKEEFMTMCLSMFDFQIHDEMIVMFRRILMIEQYKDEHMAEIFKEFFIDHPIRLQTKIFNDLIAQGLIKDQNAEALAIALYAPFFMFHTINQADEKHMREILRLHAESFYMKNFISNNAYE